MYVYIYTHTIVYLIVYTYDRSYVDVPKNQLFPDVRLS